jgi:hypothetical protein
MSWKKLNNNTKKIEDRKTVKMPRRNKYQINGTVCSIT